MMLKSARFPIVRLIDSYDFLYHYVSIISKIILHSSETHTHFFKYLIIDYTTSASHRSICSSFLCAILSLVRPIGFVFGLLNTYLYSTVYVLLCFSTRTIKQYHRCNTILSFLINIIFGLFGQCGGAVFQWRRLLPNILDR